MNEKHLNRQELKREIVRMYAACGSYMLIAKQKEKGGMFGTFFRHPTCRKIIEVWESMQEVQSVLVYNETTNAMQRNAIQCNTIEEFLHAIS